MRETEFGLLGPLLVRSGGATVAVPPGKQRTVLAALLLGGGRVVSLDELTEVLWGADPPLSARVTVQNYVMRLRKVLGEVARISTQPAGYVLSVPSGGLDVTRFEDRLAAARAAARDRSWDVAATEARAALALWRGEPLADVESEMLATQEVPRLAELRLQALELRLDADLHRGRDAEVIPELRRLAAAHPLRERLHGLLMLALYRDGRQAEALAAYQQARHVLVEQLGAEPGPGLRELHRQILAGDPHLLRVRTDGDSGTAVPRELPAPAPLFAGRAGELALLTALLDERDQTAPAAVVIAAVGGTPGVGKTALALHWAHQVASRFPDGQLYVNLRGFDPSGTPVTPAEAVRGFLDALGVPAERVPAGPDAQAGLYRSLVAGRRMLIMLDNAREEQQVRPLLPSGPASLVIVTSRNQLAGLAAADGARLLSLDVLPHAEAMQLLAARLGANRAAAEPDPVSEIATLCACLPLALSVAAARAATRPGFPLAALAADLRDTAGRLDALDAGDPAASVRAVFSWSYSQLTAEAARMFRLLGLHPGPDITAPAAASLAAAGEPAARRLLRELTRDCLITEHVPGRYAFHDLLRAYAAAQAADTDTDDDRGAATDRILDHYLYTAYAAARLMHPWRTQITLAPLSSGATPESPADHRQAMTWFEAEHQVLFAVIASAAARGSDRHAWQLTRAMTEYLQRRGHLHERIAALETGLAAATRLGDTAGQAMSRRLLAHACLQSGDYAQAAAHAGHAMRLYQRLGDRRGEGHVHVVLAAIAEWQGRYGDAIGDAEQALRLYQAVGYTAGEAEMLNTIGWYHGLLGDYRQARAFCQRSLALSAELGHRHNEGWAWDSLGYAEHHLGNFGEAAACYQRALAIVREFGDRAKEADVLTHLADTCHAAGDQPQARQAWQQALAILDDLEHPDADQVRAKLAAPGL
jgi:DNA-binding SARP family transcriptional activator/tetratricopeptide (TPR) repeat protein